MYQPQVMPGATPLGAGGLRGLAALPQQGGAMSGMFANNPAMQQMLANRPQGGGHGGGILGNGGILSMLMQRNPQLAARLQSLPAFQGRFPGMGGGNTGIVPPAFGMGRLG